MTNVLVTGASGFIGQHLAKRLMAEGNSVTCLVRRTSDVDTLKTLGMRLVQGDVNDEESVRAATAGQHVVYHLAGLTRAINPVDLFRVNGFGVRNVSRACAESGTPPVLVVVSSLAAAGPAALGRAKTEDDTPEPVSFYGRSKLAGERAARQFACRVPTTIVRPPIVLGEADRVGLAMFSSVAKFGVHMIPSRAKPRYSIVHVEDLCELIIQAGRNGRRLRPGGKHADRHDDPSASAEGIYFAASEIDPTYGELGRMIGDAVGRRHVVLLPAGRPLVWLVAGAGEVFGRIRHQPVYLDLDKAREATAGSWLCSAKAAADQLGYKVAASLHDRLVQTAEWYRRAGWI